MLNLALHTPALAGVPLPTRATGISLCCASRRVCIALCLLSRARRMAPVKRSARLGVLRELRPLRAHCTRSLRGVALRTALREPCEWHSPRLRLAFGVVRAALSHT